MTALAGVFTNEKNRLVKMAREITPENQKRIDIILSGQEALVGTISPNLRVVEAAWDDNKIVLTFIYDGPFSKEDEEESKKVAAKMGRDFRTIHIEATCLTIDYPNPLPKQEGQNYTWLFARKE